MTKARHRNRRTSLAWCAALVALLAACTVSDKATEPAKPKIVLTVFEGQSTSDPGIEDMINAVVAKDLPDVVLRWEVVSWGDKFEAQIRAKFAAGEVPDIVIGKAQDVATYVPSANLAPLPKDLSDFVVPVARTAVTVDGSVYGLPYNAFYQGVIYNKDLFQKEGLTPPTTPAEMKAVIDTLTARGIVPFAGHFLETWSVGNLFMQLAIGETLARNPRWGSQFRRGAVSFQASEELKTCFARVKQVFDHSWPDAADIDQAEADQRFAQGRAAMYVTGSWTLQKVSTWKDHPNLGIFPFPNSRGDAQLIFEPNITFMKSAQSAHPEAVDRVLHSIFANTDLAGQIVEFTKTSTLLTVSVPAEPLEVQTDIDRYRKAGQVVDASTGNNQLIWSFQAELAAHLMEWLQGRKSLDEVEAWCDKNRPLSGP